MVVWVSFEIAACPTAPSTPNLELILSIPFDILSKSTFLIAVFMLLSESPDELLSIALLNLSSTPTAFSTFD